MNPGQQAVRDNRISERNTEHRQAFYPIDEAFTDSVKLCCYGSTMRSGGHWVFVGVFIPCNDFYGSLFVRVKCKNTWQRGASRWAFMVSFRLKVEGQTVTLCVYYTDRAQLYRCHPFSFCESPQSFMFERFTLPVEKLHWRFWNWNEKRARPRRFKRLNDIRIAKTHRGQNSTIDSQEIWVEAKSITKWNIIGFLPNLVWQYWRTCWIYVPNYWLPIKSKIIHFLLDVHHIWHARSGAHPVLMCQIWCHLEEQLVWIGFFFFFLFFFHHSVK